MSGMENYLPPEYRFEAAVAEMYEPLVESIADGIDESGDIIGLDSELSREFTEVIDLSRTVAVLLKSSDENFEDVQQAIYRGLSFGLEIVNNIASGPINRHLAQYVNRHLLTQGDGISERIHADVQEYLSERPAIDGLISAYMPEIDKSSLSSHHTETAAGLMFMMCEREQAEYHLQAQVETLSIDGLNRYHRFDQ